MSEARLEQRLREELGALAHEPVPSISERVLARLPQRRARPRRTALLAVAAAALLALGIALREPLPVADVAPAPPAPALGETVLNWGALGAPLTPEAALRDEARRLASDTRHAARSLWDRLPLSSFLAREEG